MKVEKVDFFPSVRVNSKFIEERCELDKMEIGDVLRFTFENKEDAKEFSVNVSNVYFSRSIKLDGLSEKRYYKPKVLPVPDTESWHVYVIRYKPQKRVYK